LGLRILRFGRWAEGEVDDFDAGAAEELDAVFEAVLLGVDHALDACLDDELGALEAGGVR